MEFTILQGHNNSKVLMNQEHTPISAGIKTGVVLPVAVNYTSSAAGDLACRALKDECITPACTRHAVRQPEEGPSWLSNPPPRAPSLV